ncbi:MAG: TraR/DksA family transcriptional regulator [Pseudomonadota bacterium]
MTNKQLESFRSMLLKKKELLLNSSRTAFREMMAHDQKPSDEGDYAVEEVNQYLTCTIQTRDRKCLLEIEKAFARMADGDFGVCEECGEPISVERLKAQPFSSLCVDCMQDIELEQRRPA